MKKYTFQKKTVLFHVVFFNTEKKCFLQQQKRPNFGEFTYEFGLHSPFVSAADRHAENPEGQAELRAQRDQDDGFPKGIQKTEPDCAEADKRHLRVITFKIKKPDEFPQTQTPKAKSEFYHALDQWFLPATKSGP